MAGSRRREKLTNQEGGGDDDDRVEAPRFLLLRVYRRSGATAVRFWGAGKTFYAPRPPSSASFCTQSASIALSSVSWYAAHSSLHHHSFTWQVAIIMLAKLRALVGVQNQRGRRSSFEHVFCGTLRQSAASSDLGRLVLKRQPSGFGQRPVNPGAQGWRSL